MTTKGMYYSFFSRIGEVLSDQELNDSQKIKLLTALYGILVEDRKR